jgi:hypothetical protein
LKRKERKLEADDIKNVNVKSHFGPELSEELATHLSKKQLDQKIKIRNTYLQQMQLSSMDKKLEHELELAKDTKNL